jgi:serine protease Do
VRIVNERRRPNAAAAPLDPFRRFFEDRPGAPDPSVPLMAGGSGFVVAPDGLILTNAHVVRDADRLTVWFADRTSYEATVVGADPTTDVAVIRVDAKGLPALVLGHADSVQVGQWVVAVGNPGVGGGQLDYTVTSGIISAKGRPLELLRRELMQDPELQEYAGYSIEIVLQTDAVINPGYSGGPLVYLRGQVMGINPAIASTTGYYLGYGFAIPIDIARRVMEDLVNGGRVHRPRLGVQISDLSIEDAEYYKLPAVSGVLVQQAEAGGPAANAGIQAGDVLVAVDGTPVDRVGRLQQEIAAHRPGERVRIQLYRNGGPRTVDVVLGESSFDAASTRRPPAPDGGRPEARLGLRLAPLTQPRATQLGFAQAGGVVIIETEPAGAAARRGLTAGLKVETINGRAIQSLDDVAAVLDPVAPGTVVSFKVSSPDGGSRIVNVRVPK